MRGFTPVTYINTPAAIARYLIKLRHTVLHTKGGPNTSGAAIPHWDSNGIIPPVDLKNPLVKRSPWRVSLEDVVLTFGTSPERRKLLSGFLSFRSELHKIGLAQGFQWIDGSFLENIELLETRDPHDIDVVTFFHLPDSCTEKSLAETFPHVFDHDNVKDTYYVDSYIINLDDMPLEFIISNSAYWYSVWSHRRDMRWKGYFQIDLSQINDPLAIKNLECMNTGGVL